MKYIFISSLIVLFDGCSTKPSQAVKPKVDKTLPTVDLNSLKYISSMSSIALEWHPVNDPRVVGYNIYKARPSKTNKKFIKAGKLKNKNSSHWSDKRLLPNTTYLYSISTVSKDGYESKSTLPFETKTQKTFTSVPFVVAISQLAGQTKVMWKPHINEAVNYYIIQRKEKKDNSWQKIGEVEGRLSAEYIDTDLDSDTIYYYRVISKTFDDIKSYPSKAVRSKTKKLPKAIKPLKATTSLPRKIIIKWKKPKNLKTIQRYEIYRGFGNTNHLYSSIAKVSKDKDTYTDIVNSDGATRFYKVVAIDNDNQQSTLDVPSLAGKTLSKPLPPVITQAKTGGNFIQIEWKTVDKRAKYFYVYKTKGAIGFLSKPIKIGKINSKILRDKDVVSGETYSYKVQAVDKYGLMSEKSIVTNVKY
ncbi:MAG: hypothetical protein B1H07_02630 [Campylobacteraceae bacterium 4484_166]|nr:MAG: hypothetical protein B1H07_02630 [Campylobacteraceae bacterium 4484_166]